MAYKIEILATVILAVYFAIAMIRESDGRELRPSDHGLGYQESPPAGEKSAPEMMSFFGAGRKEKESSSPAFPKAFNSSGTSTWWDEGNGGSKNHARVVLLVASLVCGITGVALLLISALLYIFRYRKSKSLPSSSSNDNTK